MDRLLVHVATGLPCSPLARSWAVLECRSAWLVVDTQVKACSRETYIPNRASKIYRHKAFQITHIYYPSPIPSSLRNKWHQTAVDK